ncbi:17587_t:CDS:2 [Gigaspora margarita]|uniref:17587_t:CDS:1 n=1 Tax=Gigaspora margarita TaxID=4874 RepID=A0ABN7VK92_GIGMA|nr:17587_t:CDS:2 [Gigaspora margarita]
MPDKVILWIQELQDCLNNIYRLFGDELANAEREFDITGLDNFCESLHIGIENALNGFIKLMEYWTHLPLCICRLGGENGPEFARAFLKHELFEEFEAFVNSDTAEPAKFPLIYEFIKFRIWIHPNMDIKLQESHIQLSGLDGGIQEILQDMLRNARQNARNLRVNE